MSGKSGSRKSEEEVRKLGSEVDVVFVGTVNERVSRCSH
jgi:hypothetical protein